MSNFNLCLIIFAISFNIYSVFSGYSEDRFFNKEYHEPEFMRSRFKSLKCISFNESLVRFRYCRVKVTRNTSGLMINATLPEKLKYPLHITYIISYKYGLIYRQIFKFPEYEGCSLVKNLNNLPRAVEVLLDVAGRENLEPLLKGCPYQGDINVFLKMDLSKFPNILASGMYRINITLRTTGGAKICQGLGEFEIVSSLRTSF